MKNKIQNIFKSLTLRNMLIITIGSALGQGINFLATPFITRIFTPESIGIFGVFGSVGLIISEVSSLTYPFAVVLPKKNSEAKSLVKLSIGLSILSSLIVLLLTPLSETITSVFQISEINDYFFLLVLYVLFWNVRTINQQWGVREERFKTNSIAHIWFAIVVNLIKIGIGFFYPNPGVLIIASIIGYLVQGLYIYFNTNTRPISFKNDKLTNFGEMKSVASKYKDFAFYRSPQIFVNELANNLPTILFSIFFGPAYTGFYSMSRKVLSVPAQLVTKSVGDVIYPKLTQYSNEKKRLFPLLLKSTLALVGLGIIPFGLIILIGPQVFRIVLGPDWYSAGIYGRWLAVYLFFGFINRPSTKLITVLRIQGRFLVYQIVQSILKIGGIVLGYYLFASDVASIILFSAAGTITNFLLILYVLYYAYMYDKNLDRTIM